MIISHRLKYMFVHLPKTGGTSIRTLLTTRSYLFKVDVAGRWHNITEEEYRICPNVTPKLWTHSTLAEGINYLQDEGYNHQGYFKFLFIRNPWDMMVSSYEYHKQIIAKQENISKENLKGIMSANLKDFLTTRDRNYYKSFLLDDYTFDFIGKFENLQEDFNVACDKIGIPRQKLPHKNKSKHKHYTEYYDDETRQIVAEKYAKDIEYFNYKFGD